MTPAANMASRRRVRSASSAAARSTLEARRRPVQSWYADLTLLSRYWGGERLYHHTAPINMLYALHEALRLVLVEGLSPRYERRAGVTIGLGAGLLGAGVGIVGGARGRGGRAGVSGRRPAQGAAS